MAGLKVPKMASRRARAAPVEVKGRDEVNWLGMLRMAPSPLLDELRASEAKHRERVADRYRDDRREQERQKRLERAWRNHLMLDEVGGVTPAEQ